MIEIVGYTSEYREKLSELIKEFYKSSLSQYDMAMTDETIENLEAAVGPTSFVLLKDDEPIGIMAGTVVKQLLSEEMVYQEMVWYVDEEHRGAGIRLLKHLEQWCAEQGIKHIVMAFLYSSMPDRLLDFYKRMGYEPLEMHLLKRV